MFEDDLSGLTDDPHHDILYTVDFDDEEHGEMDFRYNDIEPL